jgi:hypothetical protein
LVCNANAAIRRPPISCGLTARLAPARNNLDLESSVRARAMMTRSGRNARLDKVTKTLSASVFSAAISAWACSMPAACRMLSSVTFAQHGWIIETLQVGRVLVDDDDLLLERVEIQHGGPPNAAPSADDEMTSHPAYLPLHPPPPQLLA